jgi:hypothetical protein
MKYRVAVRWGPLRPGAVLGASDLAGCNMKMLVARGVLVPVPDQPKSKPVAPAKKTAREPEEL